MRATTKFAAVIAACLFAGTVAQAETSPWVNKPSDEDMAAAFPRTASVDGWASIRCRILPGGELTACMVIAESSIDQRFGEAALGLSEKFKATPEFARAQSERVSIRLEFLKPLDPIVIPRLRPARFKTDKRYKLVPPGPYFPDRAFRHRQSGVVLVDCRVADDGGRLHDCRVAISTLEGWGFEEAAMRMARDGWMTAGAEPVGASAPADGYWRFRVDFPRPPYDWRMHSRPLPR